MRGTSGTSQRDRPDDDRPNDGQQEDASTAQAQAALSALLQDWQHIAEQMQTDLETFNKQRGDEAGGMMQNLRAVNREKYDYTAFLKKFAVMGEAMRINDDEFDYVFYSYGMQLFPEKRMPLIEPLEYKDVKRIREFVIAIDTSGSVMGEQVQAFLQKTYNILQSTESFSATSTSTSSSATRTFRRTSKSPCGRSLTTICKRWPSRGLAERTSARYSSG